MQRCICRPGLQLAVAIETHALVVCCCGGQHGFFVVPSWLLLLATPGWTPLSPEVMSGVCSAPRSVIRTVARSRARTGVRAGATRGQIVVLHGGVARELHHRGERGRYSKSCSAAGDTIHAPSSALLRVCWIVCLRLHIKPFFVPVGIQHTECWCRFFILERRKLCGHILRDVDNTSRKQRLLAVQQQRHWIWSIRPTV